MAVMVATSPSKGKDKGKNTCLRYGVAYLGSKNKIAADLVEHIPSAPVFYDVFAGGCYVVISEYSMPTDRFTCVWERAHISSVSGTSNYKVTERLFVVKGRENEYRRRMRQSKAQPTLFDYEDETK